MITWKGGKRKKCERDVSEENKTNHFIYLFQNQPNIPQLPMHPGILCVTIGVRVKQQKCNQIIFLSDSSWLKEWWFQLNIQCPDESLWIHLSHFPHINPCQTLFIHVSSRKLCFCPSYLDEVFGNLLAILQHPDWRDDPVPLDPDHALRRTSPRMKNSRIQLSLTVVKFSGAARLQETAIVEIKKWNDITSLDTQTWTDPPWLIKLYLIKKIIIIKIRLPTDNTNTSTFASASLWYTPITIGLKAKS